MITDTVQGVIDPRLSIVEKRLLKVNRILVFASGKGGVGKSSLSTAAALQLAKEGSKTGLLDFDFYGASDHIFLGSGLSFPEESFGLLPRKCAYGLKFMSIASFTGENGIPMRGGDITNVILELLSVTIWGELDYLVIDMPPGIGDEVLDLIRFVKRSEIIIVTSSSLVSMKVVRRLLSVFLKLKVPVLGILGNLARDPKPEFLETLGEEMGSDTQVPVIGNIFWDPGFESAIGVPDQLLETKVGEGMKAVLAFLTK